MTKNQELAQAIAKTLGFSVEQPHENDNYFKLVSPEGVALGMHCGGYAYKGRIHFGTHYPQYQSDEQGYMRSIIQRDFDRSMRYDSAPWSGITVANTKSPEQMAKDVTRRFLPVYLPLWEKAKEYAEGQATYWASKGSTKEAINKALLGVSGVRVGNYWQNTATLEIEATPALAAVIAAAVKMYQQGLKSAQSNQ